jgi:hypothetical protein
LNTTRKNIRSIRRTTLIAYRCSKEESQGLKAVVDQVYISTAVRCFVNASPSEKEPVSDCTEKGKSRGD